jgi:nucleoid-associated protein YgaU
MAANHSRFANACYDRAGRIGRSERGASVEARPSINLTMKGDRMGLFDFVKDIGKKIFPGEAKAEDAATKIKQEIETANLGISGLQVTYADGKCSLAGECPSPEAMQKAVLIAGNIQGVSEVNISGLKVPQAKQEEKVEYYIIQKGDTLSKIAKQYYGDPNKYPRIFEANREVIKDANLIFPGQKVRIPLD